MGFYFLSFLSGSNWILHIVSELIFAVSKKKYTCPEFPVLECGDAEKYQVSTNSFLTSVNERRETLPLEPSPLGSTSINNIMLSTTPEASSCLLTTSSILFWYYLIFLQKSLNHHFAEDETAILAQD